MIFIKIDHLLELSPSDSSILEIESFLNSQSLTVKNYLTVFIHLLKMKFELGYFKDVYEYGLKYYRENEKDLKSQEAERFYELIFLAALELKQFEVAYKFYSLRKEVLPVIKRYLAELNLIEFKKRTHQAYQSDLEATLQDVIPDDVRLKLSKELLNIYLEKNEDPKALLLIESMKKIDPSQSYIPDYLNVLFKLEKYDEAKSFALQFKGHPKFEMDAFLTLLKIYLLEKDYHRATILDADFSHKFDEMDSNFLIETYTLLIELYTKLNNKFSIDLYQKKLKALQRVEKKTEKNEYKEAINVPDDTHFFEIKEPFKEKKKSSQKLEQMHTLIDLMAFSHQITETKQLRDFLRNFFMKVEEYITVKDMIVFTKRDEMLYHYKKERLYDKQLVKTIYQESLIGEILNDGEERFGRPSAFKYDLNILTLKPFDDTVKYVYGFALFDLGVFMVHLDKEINDPAVYFDLFKGLATIIYTCLSDEEKRTRLKIQNDFLNQIINSEILAIRIMSAYQQQFNKAAQKLLYVDQHLPLESFMNRLYVHEVKEYDKTISRLFEKPGLFDTSLYHFNEKQIKEKMISIKDGDEVKIVSIFEDLTSYFEEKSKLVMEATVDFETSLSNLNALNQRMPELINEKGSMILINFNESILPIYGYEDALQFFKEFGQVTKKFFEDGETYRFSTYQLFVYVPYNDIRTVTKTIKDYLKVVSAYQSQVIHYEKFQPKLSIIRYPVVTEEKNPAKIYRYLELSLDFLKRQEHGEDYIFFEHKIYEDEVFEQQVINYLNEAIEGHQLALTFNQLIDLTRNVVWQYESDLILDNIDIDSKYLLAIAKKRNRLFDLEKYHITMVLEFLSLLEKETEKLIKITIPVSKETFLDPNFNPFIIGLFKKYGIPFEFIRFKVKGGEIKSTQYLTQINELTETGIGIDTTAIDVALSFPFNALHLDDKKGDSKWFDYIKMLKVLLESHQMALVIRNVKSKEQKEYLENLGIRYVEGPIYKKVSAENLLYKIAGNKHGENN